MNYRYMRVIVFFDLPVLTSLDKKNYRNFRKFLITRGYAMVQESVYSKIVLNYTTAKSAIANVRKFSPPKGLVQLLVITEKQYNSMEFIVGEHKSDVIQTDEKLVVV